MIQLDSEHCRQVLSKLYWLSFLAFNGFIDSVKGFMDGEFLQAKIKVDAYYKKQALIAKAIQSEGIANAKSIQEMNHAMESAGGEALVKLRIAEALQGKKIVLLPVSEGGMNLKTTDVNQLIEMMGVRKLAKQ